jgi:hypothetical protein
MDETADTYGQYVIQDFVYFSEPITQNFTNTFSAKRISNLDMHINIWCRWIIRCDEQDGISTTDSSFSQITHLISNRNLKIHLLTIKFVFMETDDINFLTEI